MGSWWIYVKNSDDDGSGRNAGSLKMIPSSREDVFADSSIDLKSKRSLMKFLKFITDPEAFSQAIEAHGTSSFEGFLTHEFNIPDPLQPILHALTLSLNPATETLTSYALPRILRHLSSIGVFGPGFGSVTPKWGGLAEVTQVACRALAVGGGIYMLGRGIQSMAGTDTEEFSTLNLSDGESIKARWRAGCREDFPQSAPAKQSETVITRRISIISSPLLPLFPAIADGAPPPVCSVVTIPPGSILHDGSTLSLPVYLIVHTNETGECPSGQCKSQFCYGFLLIL